jgi:D-xylose transport system ATP-binding protein
MAPDTGEIYFEGRPVLPLSPARARTLGIETVYQDLSLCPNLDVVANFFMGRERVTRRFGFPFLDERTMRLETEEALQRIGARIPSLEAQVEVLSGGQRQAIELARFVHWGGKLVILDEPFAALSVEQTRRGLELIQRVKSRGIAVIVITHNLLHAFQVADRLVVLRQGRIVGASTRSETTHEEIITLITGNLVRSNS